MPRVHTPLLEQLADQLRARIKAHFAPGSALPSLATLCREHDVSINTIRTALAMLSQEGLVESRHGRGVFVTARANRTRIGLLMEQDILNPRTSTFYTQVPRFLRQYLLEQGAQVRLYIGTIAPGTDVKETTCPDFLEDLAAHRLDGIACIGTLPNPSWSPLADRLHVPVVGDTTFFQYGAGFDFNQMVRQGVQRLADQGARRIAMMTWDAGQISIFREVLAAHGLEFRDRWVRRDLPPALPGAGWEEFREIWTAYPDKPDGLLACDDLLFREALPAILQAHIRVPQNLRIVTHTNVGSEPFVPFPLTMAEVDPGLVARHLGDMILQLIRAEPVPQPHILLPVSWREDVQPRMHDDMILEHVVANG